MLALFVVPIAIEQYPEFFKDSPWILPLAVVIVCICWLVPLLVHDRVRRIHGWILRYLGTRLGWLVVGLSVVVTVGVVVTLGYTLYGKHKRHLEARLQGLRPRVSNDSREKKAPPPTQTASEDKERAQESIKPSVPKKPVSEGLKPRGDLKSRVLRLSDDLMKFSWDRDKKRSEALKAHPFVSPEALARQDEEWDTEAFTRFDNMYGAEVRSILRELADAGVDVSSVNISTDGPRKMGWQLSVLADHIGKSPPFERILTKQQRDELLNQYSLPVELYAYQQDKNSFQLAKQFQAGFIEHKWKGAEVVHPLGSRSGQTGIIVKWQYGDNWEGHDFVGTLQHLGFSTTQIIDGTLNLGANGIRVEIWPER